MKKTLLVLIALMMIISFAGCKAKETYQPGDYIKALFSEGGALDMSDKDFCYHAIVTSGDASSLVQMGMKGENIYVSVATVDGSETYKMMYYEGDSYIVMDTQKMIIKYTGANQLSEATDELEYDFAELLNEEGIEITAGEEEYNSVKYKFEKIDEDGETTTFYFDTKTNELKYVVSAYATIEYKEYHSSCEEDLFTLPDDYTLYEY